MLGRSVNIIEGRNDVCFFFSFGRPSVGNVSNRVNGVMNGGDTTGSVGIGAKTFGTATGCSSIVDAIIVDASCLTASSVTSVSGVSEARETSAPSSSRAGEQDLDLFSTSGVYMVSEEVPST